jgi:hypothetical protein
MRKSRLYVDRGQINVIGESFVNIECEATLAIRPAKLRQDETNISIGETYG